MAGYIPSWNALAQLVEEVEQEGHFVSGLGCFRRTTGNNDSQAFAIGGS